MPRTLAAASLALVAACGGSDRDGCNPYGEWELTDTFESIDAQCQVPELRLYRQVLTASGRGTSFELGRFFGRLDAATCTAHLVATGPSIESRTITFDGDAATGTLGQSVLGQCVSRWATSGVRRR
jgi:hypothetical protein